MLKLSTRERIMPFTASSCNFTTGQMRHLYSDAVNTLLKVNKIKTTSFDKLCSVKMLLK